MLAEIARYGESRGNVARARDSNIHGQYFEAFPDHAAELDQPLTPDLARAESGVRGCILQG
jgi:hypothetical protein